MANDLRKLKVLPLPSWAEVSSDWKLKSFLIHRHEPTDYIPPITNRPGMYLLGDKCWFVNSLGCWEWKKNRFMWELDIQSVPSLSIKEYNALRDICATKYATKEQTKLLYNINWSLDHITNPKSRLSAFRSRKRLLAFKKAKGIV